MDCSISIGQKALDFCDAGSMASENKSSGQTESLWNGKPIGYTYIYILEFRMFLELFPSMNDLPSFIYRYYIIFFYYLYHFWAGLLESGDRLRAGNGLNV